MQINLFKYMKFKTHLKLKQNSIFKLISKPIVNTIKSEVTQNKFRLHYSAES
jgi:hypothetical protein